MVKSRIAIDKGNDKALAIYEELLGITKKVCNHVDANKHVYFNEFIDLSGEWDDRIYSKNIQQGKDLGQKMHQAIGFELKKATRVVLIGSDCPYLRPEHIQLAFDSLKNHDVVLGPCTDGGYYLIGMTANHSELFKNISWSTTKVLQQTIDQIKSKQLQYSLLETLSDIDYWGDWENYLKTRASLNLPLP